MTLNCDLTHDLDPWISRSNFEKVFNSVMGCQIDMEWKGWVDRMLDPLCDFELWPHPWPWSLIFKVKFWKSHNSGTGCLIDMERKGCESTECRTHVMTFNFDLTHDLDLEFQRQILKLLYPRNGRVDQHGTKGMWVDRVLYLLCDLELWPWPWIFTVKF